MGFRGSRGRFEDSHSAVNWRHVRAHSRVYVCTPKMESLRRIASATGSNLLTKPQPPNYCDEFIAISSRMTWSWSIGQTRFITAQTNLPYQGWFGLVCMCDNVLDWLTLYEDLSFDITDLICDGFVMCAKVFGSIGHYGQR